SRRPGLWPHPDDLLALDHDGAALEDPGRASPEGRVARDDLGSAGDEDAHGHTCPIAAASIGPTAPIRCSPPATTCSPPMTTSLTSWLPATKRICVGSAPAACMPSSLMEMKSASAPSRSVPPSSHPRE